METLQRKHRALYASARDALSEWEGAQSALTSLVGTVCNILPRLRLLAADDSFAGLDAADALPELCRRKQMAAFDSVLRSVHEQVRAVRVSDCHVVVLTQSAARCSRRGGAPPGETGCRRQRAAAGAATRGCLCRCHVTRSAGTAPASCAGWWRSPRRRAVARGRRGGASGASWGLGDAAVADLCVAGSGRPVAHVPRRACAEGTPTRQRRPRCCLTMRRFNTQAALVKSISPSTPERDALSLQVRVRGPLHGGRRR